MIPFSSYVKDVAAGPESSALVQRGDGGREQIPGAVSWRSEATYFPAENLHPFATQVMYLASQLAKEPHVAVLVVAHPDDESLAGGLLHELSEVMPVFVIVMTSDPSRRAELNNALGKLGAPRPPGQAFVFDFLDGALTLEQVKSVLRPCLDRIEPNIVLCHSNDFHPDHRKVAQAVDDLCRTRAGVSILEFEVGQFGRPAEDPTSGVVITFDAPTEQCKSDAIRSYTSQADKPYFAQRALDAGHARYGHAAGSHAGERWRIRRLFLQRTVCPCGRAMITFRPRSSSRPAESVSTI